MTKLIFGILHGLWFMANIIAANRVAELHPHVEGRGLISAGVGFGLLTCVGTILSFALTSTYLYPESEDHGWLSLLACMHTVIIVGVVYGWISYLG